MDNVTYTELSQTLMNNSVEVFGVGVEYPEWLRILLIILGVTYFTVGIPGNLLIFFSIVKIRRLRVRINIFIANLAIADLINVGFIYPFNVVDLIIGRYPANESFCIFIAFMENTTFPCGLANLFFIAVSRYTKICHTVTHDKIFTLRKIVIICVFCWTFGPVFTIYNLVTSSLGYDKVSRNCIFNKSTSAVFTSFFIQFITLPPISISLFCYIKIWRKTMETKRRIWNTGTTSSRQRLAQESRSNKSNFVIFTLFTIFYMPFTASAIFAKHNPIIQGIVTNLCFANCSLNCIVYGLMNKNIRKCYRQILPSVWTTNTYTM